jgi:hypothetical protein
MASEPVNLDRLVKAMHGGDPEIARGEAFALLAASPHPQREELLGGLLRDPQESSAIRSAAAIALGRIPTHDSTQVLLGNLHLSEPRVQAEILRSLGRIGGTDALANIETLHFPAHDHRQDVVEFAAALIAHRLGLEGHELPLPPEERRLSVPVEESRPVLVSMPAPEQAAKVIADLARQPYGIEYDRTNLVRIECAGRVNVLCPNRELSVPGGIARLAQKKALAGIVAYQSAETGDHSVSYLVMVSPSTPSGLVNIVAPRCSGRPGLAGTGEVKGKRLEFRLRSVERPGAFPLELAGEVAPAGVHFDQAVLSLNKVASRRPALRQPA